MPLDMGQMTRAHKPCEKLDGESARFWRAGRHPVRLAMQGFLLDLTTRPLRLTRRNTLRETRRVNRKRRICPWLVVAVRIRPLLQLRT
jgi:hypothetical protein